MPLATSSIAHPAIAGKGTPITPSATSTIRSRCVNATHLWCVRGTSSAFLTQRDLHYNLDCCLSPASPSLRVIRARSCSIPGQ